MIKTFDSAVKFLEKYVPTSDKKYPGYFGLERMKEFCNLLNNPQLAYPTIHVGGTSGKGSTSTILASILATKYKIGLHTSPHLVRINERITVMEQSKKDISDKDFIDLINEVKPVVEKMEKGKLGAPSYFEIVTVMAFLYFQRQKVDIAVIEVGLGGKYDGTNVIKPIVAVLTNVGLDHTDVLGNTVEKIAEDKVGIIKPGIRVVSGIKQPSVVEVVKRKEKMNLSLLGKDFSYQVESVTEKGSIFDYFGEITFRNLKLNLLGGFQVENAVLAIKACEQLAISNWQLAIGDIRDGLKRAFIPGRLEIINRNPLVILDGAHNTDKMKALVQSIETIFSGKKVRAIVAIKEDKNAKEILEILLPICKEIILTSYKIKADQGIVTSYTPKELETLLKCLNTNIVVSIVPNPKKALESVVKLASKDDLILVTGSLYLVGEIKKHIDNTRN